MAESVSLPDSLKVYSQLTFGSTKVAEILRGPFKNIINPTSAATVSNNSLNFNIQPSNERVIIDPYMYFEIDLNVTVAAGVTGVTGGVKAYLENNFALRQYPLHSVMNNLAIQLNSQSSSVNPSNFVHFLTRNQNYISEEGQAHLQTMTPIMPDQFTEYNDGVGSMKNPLNGYAAGGEHYSEPRGAFNDLFTDVSDGVTGWNFTYKLREPLLHPWTSYFPDENREGIPYVTTQEINCGFGQLSRMFSLNADACPLITGITVNFTAAKVVQNWLTIPNNQILPERSLRSFSNFRFDQTNLGTFAGGASNQVTSQSITLSGIPKKMWIYVVDQDLISANSTDYTKSDITFHISKLDLQFDQGAGVLTTQRDIDLHEACEIEEGSFVSFVQAKTKIGSALCLSPAKLFQLTDDQAPGVPGNFTFIATVTCTNLSASSVTPILVIASANEFILEISKNQTSRVIDKYITVEDVRRANSLPAIPTSLGEQNIYGGKWTDKLRRLVRKGIDFARDQKLISRGLAQINDPRAQAASTFAQNVGFGYQQYPPPQYASGGMRLPANRMQQLQW